MAKGHEDLLFGEVLFTRVWERIGGYVAEAREAADNPLAYRDAEMLMQRSEARKARVLATVGAAIPSSVGNTAP